METQTFVLEQLDDGTYRLTLLPSREIREAATLELLLRSLVADFGYYLRKKG